ncbi:hypothetical protein [Nonomuraea diastatica]|uniref:Uncharacterized protein n=1 Tax=Nonomuraea diastatica TaxID=1848329 RepID=A0A4R4VHN6_9ACTN|nr:hypothetical protein [Nonomuraea diastatica]TDD02243.1 hypothetical protein E1294_51295 [Nonomuraea diastatica]
MVRATVNNEDGWRIWGFTNADHQYGWYDRTTGGWLLDERQDRGDRAATAGLASAWAAGHGLGGLPLDLHESGPRQRERWSSHHHGVEVPAVVLTTDTTVEVRTYRTVASYVRAFGGDPARLAVELPDWERLTVVAPPGRPRQPRRRRRPCLG